MKYKVTTTDGEGYGVFFGKDLDHIKMLILRAGHIILQILEDDGSPDQAGSNLRLQNP